MEKGEKHRIYLAMIVYMQHTDLTYDSVDFNNPISTLTYFKKLLQIFSAWGWGSEGEIDRLFTDMMQILKRTEKGSIEFAEVQAQHIMRSAAEKVHGAFRDLNRDPFKTTHLAIDVMLKAIHDLVELINDFRVNNEEDNSEYLPVDSLY
jgi:hypothetical protein